MRNNRNYIWNNDGISKRPEYPFIEGWINDVK